MPQSSPNDDFGAANHAREPPDAQPLVSGLPLSGGTPGGRKRAVTNDGRPNSYFDSAPPAIGCQRVPGRRWRWETPDRVTSSLCGHPWWVLTSRSAGFRSEEVSTHDHGPPNRLLGWRGQNTSGMPCHSIWRPIRWRARQSASLVSDPRLMNCFGLTSDSDVNTVQRCRYP